MMYILIRRLVMCIFPASLYGCDCVLLLTLLLLSFVESYSRLLIRARFIAYQTFYWPMCSHHIGQGIPTLDILLVKQYD